MRGGLTAFNNILQTGLVDDGLLWPEAAATFKIAEVAPYVLRADLALVLGMVILPSAMLMIDSFTAGQSVCDMFQEGVIPGMLLAVAYVIAIWFMACFLRGFVGGRIVDDSEWMSPREIASKTLPTLGLITIVCSICMISRARPG